MKLTRLALVLSAAVLAATMPAALAAGPSKGAPQLTDACGDGPQQSAQPGLDIKSFQLSTTGLTTTKTVKAGRKAKRVSTYAPKNLVAVLTLCGPVSTVPSTNYTVDTATSGCNSGSFQFEDRVGDTTLPSFAQTGDVYISGCGANTSGTGPSEILADVRAQPAGNTITWVVPLSDLGSSLPLGSTFTTFRARTDVDDVVTGELGTWFVGSVTSGAAGDIDFAQSDAVWRLS